MIRIRFCTEGDDLDEDTDGWHLTRAEDRWIRRMTVEICLVSPRPAERFYGFLAEQIGKGYDIRPLAGVKCDLDAHTGRKWSCADMVHRALVEIGRAHV